MIKCYLSNEKWNKDLKMFSKILKIFYNRIKWSWFGWKTSFIKCEIEQWTHKMWKNNWNGIQLWIDLIGRLCVCVCPFVNTYISIRTMHEYQYKSPIEWKIDDFMRLPRKYVYMPKCNHSCRRISNSISHLTFRPFSNWIADLLIRCEMNCLFNCSSVQTIHESFPFGWIIVQRNANAANIEWIYNWSVHNVSAEYPNEIVVRCECRIDSILSQHSHIIYCIILWFRWREEWWKQYRNPESGIVFQMPTFSSVEKRNFFFDC